MDGDAAPLSEIVAFKEEYGAWLMVDEAHATGLYGQERTGLCEELGVADRVEVRMGTLGKAIGTAGGFIAGEVDLIRFLLNHARSFIFTTGDPPALAVASLTAIELIRGMEGGMRVQQLRNNIGFFKEKLPRHWEKDGDSPIVPLIVGNEKKAVSMAEQLLKAGFVVPAIRFPTVSRGEARLRVTIRADHAPEQIDQLIRALEGFKIDT
jgi:7-keto-8-aminopelargonate synthetase-like enzyme